MTNVELIKALRDCVNDEIQECDECPFNKEYRCREVQTAAAADALEAADKKIEQLEKQVAAYQKLIKRCRKQMCKLETENKNLQDKVREKVIMLQRTKEGYVDG